MGFCSARSDIMIKLFPCGATSAQHLSIMVICCKVGFVQFLLEKSVTLLELVSWEFYK